MPTYVYECAKCGDEFEVWQSIKDDPLKRHPGSCRGKLTKVIQPAGIVLKGSGFYKNDSRNGSKRSTSPASADTKSSDSGSDSSSGSESSSSSDSSGSPKSEPSSSGTGSSGNGSPGNGSPGKGSSTKKPAKTSSSSSS